MRKRKITRYFSQAVGGLFRNPRGILIWMIIFIPFNMMIPNLEPIEIFSTTLYSQPIIFLLRMLSLLGSIVIIRMAVAIILSRIMKDSSLVQRTESVPMQDTPEFPAAGLPELIKFNQRDYSLKDNHHLLVWSKAIDHAKSVFKLVVLRDIAASLLYLLIPIPFLLILPNILKYKFFGEDAYLHSIVGIGVVILTLILVGLRFLFHFKQFNPYDIKFNRRWEHPYIWVIRSTLTYISQPQPAIIMLIWILISMIFAVNGALIYLFIYVVPIAGHLVLLRFFQPKEDKNIKLLILRTFQIRENTTFTFDKLARFWKHIGNMFSVVDTSYLLFTYSLSTIRFLVYATLLQSVLLLLPWYGFLSAVFLIITFEYIKINRSAIRSNDDFLMRLKRFENQPRKRADLTFRNMFSINHGNTWRSTVAELVKRTDVVMMDLRGFSEHKKGCEYEINYLVDHIPIERVVFLISDEDLGNLDLIRHSIHEQWQTQRTDSPNRYLEQPQIRLYVASDEAEWDVDRFFSHLFWAAKHARSLTADEQEVIREIEMIQEMVREKEAQTN